MGWFLRAPNLLTFRGEGKRVRRERLPFSLEVDAVPKADPLLIVGSIAFDDLDMPSGDHRDVLGGSATYSSLAASFFSAVRVVGVVGDDFPAGHLEALRQRKIDTEGVEHAKGKTFRWHGRYSKDLASRVSLDTQLNVFGDFRPKIPAAYKKTPFVLLGNIHPQLQIEVLEQIERPRLVAADTMNFWISGEPQALGELLKRIDLLVINDEEARQLAGVQNLRKAALEIQKRGPAFVLIKQGEHGALLFDDRGPFFVPAYPLEEVRDPTGAGDTFAGALLGTLARTGIGQSSPHSLRRAMFYAAALGSFCVEDIGPARLLTLTAADLKARIDEFVSLVDYGGSLSLD
jgi:sugar/nucleoside kinase (ribokinase family)